MPTLHDFRADFSAGRTGSGLRIRQDTKAYRASVFDADNMMIEADNRISRRWGTLDRGALQGKSRLERWTYAEADTQSFILVFGHQRLDIYDLTLALRQTFTGQPWTATTMRFMTIASEGSTLTIADASFRTQILKFDHVAGDFAIRDFAFQISEDKTRMLAPFYDFVGDVPVYSTIYTSEGTDTAYGSELQTAAGFVGSGDYDLEAGTGQLIAQSDVFTTDYVGSRLRVAGGEVEVTGFVNARRVDIKVHKNMGIPLDTNPVFVRKGSKLAEVAAFDHGLRVGDYVIFLGVDSGGRGYVRHGIPISAGGNLTASPPDGAAAYYVRNIVDKDHFEIQWAYSNPRLNTAARGDSSSTPTSLETKDLTMVEMSSGTTESGTPSLDELVGGSDMRMIPLKGMRGFKEPAFSDARGWPQACGIHESRLFLGGTATLPDAAWGSRIFALEDFDPGEGGPNDAIMMYSIGDQSRVRHFVSSFDLVILTDNGEYYAPGTTDAAMSQATARAIPATKDGSAYTTPFMFDSGLFFVDAEGQHIREMIVDGNEGKYVTNPSSIVVPDWVKGPVDATSFRGGTFSVTPYVIYVNDEDGSLLVMHSRRKDEAFGFMRWTLKDGNFVSIAGVRNRLFACVERDGAYSLLEFDTSENYITMDFGADLSAGSATNQWSVPRLANREIQMESEGSVYTPTTVDGAGDFTTPEAVTTLRVGEAMPFNAVIHPAIAASGQGPKIGKMQRLVSAEVHWNKTTTGRINGDSILDAIDVPAMSAPNPVDEWRQHTIGLWGREPRLRIEGDTPGHIGMRGLVMNVYF